MLHKITIATIALYFFAVFSAYAQEDSLPSGNYPDGPFAVNTNLIQPKSGELFVKVTSSGRNKIIKLLKKKYPNRPKPSNRQINIEIAKIVGLRISETLGLNSWLATGTGVNYQKVQRAKAQGLIARAEPNYKVFAFANDPADTFYKSGFQWGLNNTGAGGFFGGSGLADADVDAPEAWEVTTGSQDVIVGILDTGISINHKDLQENLWINPYEIAGNNIDDDGNGYIDDIHGADFINKDGNPDDDNMHGTHVAGIVAAQCFNNRGVCGVAPTVKLMGLKLLSSRGDGDGAGIVRALQYVINLKKRGVNIRVLNASFGGGEALDTILDYLKEANRLGILIAVAAGNSSSDNDSTPIYPANYRLPNLISVAALDRSGKLASFSNYGSNYVDVAAPGAGIWSTFLFGFYFPFDGTSMATPFVSAVAALVASSKPWMNPSEIKQEIFNTVKPLPGVGLEGKMKYPGIVSAYRAIL